MFIKKIFRLLDLNSGPLLFEPTALLTEPLITRIFGSILRTKIKIMLEIHSTVLV